ncbi:MAG: NADP-dependent isocitrate dehydrogenase [Candidatus Kapabacteria bacterium]|jgi:isocitrate dehydrogenase|nr:NADP-dependent isocitrate dehydrogenase [Candidatus Kapabacteria bacterium]
MSNYKIVWTKIDEAPELASYCLLPIIKRFTDGTDLSITTSDISLSGRILANFPEYLEEHQRIPDNLSMLGELVKSENANIIKLPNISASIPQLHAAIKELRSKGFNVPEYPEEAINEEQRAIKDRYSKCLGSAVNPVLREGNSDRRAAASVKKFAQKYPHKMMKPWLKDSKTRVAFMKSGDFYGTETSYTMNKEDSVKIELHSNSGEVKVLKTYFKLKDKEVIDTAVMNVRSLRAFYDEQIMSAKNDDVLFSLHLKATMMKVSDPIMFGHAVSVYYKEALDKHSSTLKEIGANVNNGLADILEKIKKLPDEKRAEIENDINQIYKSKPALAMVDSRYGITNLHVPNNIIIDASMPNVVRDGGKMWNSNDELQDCIAVIPDRAYASMYAAIIDDARINGQFDPAVMGSVSNVGLMAQKAEEYGSHDKTFESESDGIIKVIDSQGNVLLEQKVEKGDIFRMCQTKDLPVKDWTSLAVKRARSASVPAIFWLDENRAHDREIIKKVNEYLKLNDTEGLDIKIMNPADAMNFTLERVRKGLDTISVTGNVLRDYLTDLFPILELGTSARMLSIVPLLNGGGLFETGAGGSAPKHVQQLLKENHLRWDSLGEYCALVPSLELAYEKTGDEKIKVIANALDKAIGVYLENGKLPSRKAGEIDNRASSFYLAMYWANELSVQNENTSLKERFSGIYSKLKENELKIFTEMIECQGKQADIGGYYMPNQQMTESIMRPSKTFNDIIDNM